VDKKPIQKLGKGGIQKKPFPPKTNFDARLKLIQSNRHKISDARQVIAEHARKNIKDARELLSSKKPKFNAKKQAVPRIRPGPAVFTVKNDPLAMMMDEDSDDEDLAYQDLKVLKAQASASLRRTVKNDIFSSSPPRHMPRLPTFSIANREPSPPSLDPFDCYVVPTRRSVAPPPMPPRLERLHSGSKMSAHMDSYDRPSQKGILRQSSRTDHDDRFESDRYMVPESARARRYSNDSAGIFAKVVDHKLPSSLPRTKGYRIIISNLVPSVSENDVEELFGEVGDLLAAKLIRPGVAEVLYRNEGDAEKAHEIYHNRLIDGEPMKIQISNGSVTKPSAYYRS
jgi:hypothetical protein